MAAHDRDRRRRTPVPGDWDAPLVVPENATGPVYDAGVLAIGGGFGARHVAASYEAAAVGLGELLAERLLEPILDQALSVGAVTAAGAAAFANSQQHQQLLPAAKPPRAPTGAGVDGQRGHSAWTGDQEVRE